MGGYGSGRTVWPLKRDVIEDCMIIDIAWMKRNHYIHSDRHNSGFLDWARGGKRTNSINYEAHLDLESPFIRLHYIIDGTEKIDYQVLLVTSQPNYSGLRWWFICPNTNCRRRVGKLYLAPGSKHFFRRACQDLTYTSCQESHKFDSVYSIFARDSGMSIQEVKEALRRGEFL